MASRRIVFFMGTKMAMNTAARQAPQIIGGSVAPDTRGTRDRAPLELMLGEGEPTIEERRRCLAASRRAIARRTQAASRALLVPGLCYIPQLLTQGEERTLLEALRSLLLPAPIETRAPSDRRSFAFGWNDDFAFAGLEHAGPIPDFLQILRERVAAFSGTQPELWQQITATSEATGPGHWQQERPVFEQFAEVVLGDGATLRLRQRDSEGFDRRTLPLDAGSAYLLSGEARHCWERRLDHAGPSGWTVRLRTLSSRGLRR